MLAAARLTALSARGARPALWILPLFVAFDLGPWGYGYMWTTPPATIAQVAASVSAPPFIERGARISFPLGAANCDANAAVLRGYAITSAQAGLPPARVLPPSGEAALRLSGVNWRRVGDVWTRVDALPRARLIGDVRVSVDIARDVSTIDLAKTALVSETLAGVVELAGSVVVAEDRPGRIALDVSATGRNLLVTTEAYHAGWRGVDQDGRTALVLGAYGDYLAAVVERGTGRIVLSFDPDSTRIGIWMSVAGLALTAAFALLLVRRRVEVRNRPPISTRTTRRG
jgi:hypothetical protein